MALMMKRLWRKLLPTAAMATLAGTAYAAAQAPAAQVEFLDRGAVAVKADKGVLISWRARVNDAPALGFNVYRDGKKLNAAPIMDRSNLLDEGGAATANYEVREVLGTTEGASAPARRIGDFLSVPLQKPADGVTPDGKAYGYTANDASVGDVDGDGVYEIFLKWDPTNSADNAFGQHTGPVYLDCYRLDGGLLWRVNLGPNIRAGAHYTQFQVADYDGDGKAELIVKSADGTVDGQGKVIGDASAKWAEGGGEVEQGDRTGARKADDGKLMANLTGRILRGPEYLTVFEGGTGRAVDTIAYPAPRGPSGHQASREELKERWGDGYGNRSERYLAGTAWLDGVHPSAIFARGYYARSTIAAVDYRGGKLATRWYFDSQAEGVPPGYSGQGNHQFSVADVDGDGRHEIIYGSMALDDDGKPLWTAKLFHGDAMHVSDLLPSRPGLEKWGVHEDMRQNGNIGSALLDARTGEVIFKTSAEKDTGRGAAGDIDPRHPGAEFWGSNNNTLYDAAGQAIGNRPAQMNFMVWWDGDALRELLDKNKVCKWDWKSEKSVTLLDAQGAASNNGTKSTPALSADLFGDWREEVMLRSEDNTSLRIYSTGIPTAIKLTTLMQDPQYRAAIAGQNTAYNQPPWPSYFIGDGMKAPPASRVVVRNWAK